MYTSNRTASYGMCAEYNYRLLLTLLSLLLILSITDLSRTRFGLVPTDLINLLSFFVFVLRSFCCCYLLCYLF